MTTKSTGDLFDCLQPRTDEDQRPQQEAFLNMTVDQWIDAEGMHTIELSSPRGKLWMTKSKKAYKRLVEAGEVVFSPLEVERFIALVHKDKGSINERLLDHIYNTKRLFGARLEEMSLALPSVDDQPELEELEDAARPA